MWTKVRMEVIKKTERFGQVTEVTALVDRRDWRVLMAEIDEGLFEDEDLTQFAAPYHTDYNSIAYFSGDVVMVTFERQEDEEGRWNGGKPWIEYRIECNWYGDFNPKNDAVDIQNMMTWNW